MTGLRLLTNPVILVGLVFYYIYPTYKCNICTP